MSEVSQYVRNTHRSTQCIQPSYTVHGEAIGWNKVAGTDICLPRKDVKANIDAIDIKLEDQGNTTKVIFEITYNPQVGKNYLLAHRCIRGLFNIKLNVLKRDLEADTNRVQLTPEFV